MRSKAERKAHRQEVKKKIVGAVKKAVGKVSQFVEGSVLLPFVPLMNAKIRKAGQTPANKIVDKAVQVHAIIKGQNFDERENVIEDVASIIKAVVKFFQGRRDELKAKKEAGEELTDGEQKTVDHVDAVENAVVEAAVGEVKDKAKSYFSNPLLIVGVVVVVGFLALRKK